MTPGTDSCPPIKGFGGELYRSPFGTAKRKRELPPTLDAMAEALAGFWQRHDPLDVLPRSERDHQRQRLSAWVHETSAAVRFDLIPRKFYVDHRLGHWSGPLDQAKAGIIDLNPLLSPATASRVFELSADTRRQERFHYEVMRRTAPELLTVPFLRDGWSKHLVAEVDESLPTEPYPTSVTPTPRALSSWQWHFFETEGRAMRALFDEAARRTPMGEIADLRKLKKVARRADRIDSFVHGKALLSAVGVALSLLGRSEPVTDTA